VQVVRLISGVLYLALAAGFVLGGAALLQQGGLGGLLLIAIGVLFAFVGWRLIAKGRRPTENESADE
jgi:hypothetical protein